MRHLFELFIFFLILIVLPDWYIYRTYIRNYQQKWIRFVYAMPGILLLLGMLAIFSTFEPRSESMNRLSGFLILFLCICVPKAIFVCCIWVFKALARIIHRSFHEIMLAMFISMATMGYLIYGATEGKQHFQVVEASIYSKDIPEAFHGYRIVQIADIHVGSWMGNTKPLQKAVRMINDLKPDLIVFTGDLVNNLATELDEFIPVLSQLKAKHGVYSVLGNHDYSTYIRWNSLEEQAKNFTSLKDKQVQMGWKMLNNSHIKLYQGTDSIALIGVENSGRPPFPDYARLTEAMTGTEGMFQILLSHDPSHWQREVLPSTDIQLTLSGHTHDMQTRIFGFSPSALVYPEHSGLYQEGNQMLYVNTGLGHLMYPMRLGAWPEITLLTLKNK
ncbi:MAG: metallophosphoesterase [Bacteroidaceae bacterium]|nr:metallophosphoesterase [Bacteroidaceae bacterium]